MSERGSFVTEYIYCEKCRKVASGILAVPEPTRAPYHSGGWHEGSHTADPAVIAGHIKGSGSGDEFLYFEIDLYDELYTQLCHPLHVTVMADNGYYQVYCVVPGPSRPLGTSRPVVTAQGWWDVRAIKGLVPDPKP